ncbi:MAG: hypothetical protein KAI33_01935, partial [Elusimicrobiales bacterium]|nr:hypothetical protein [Elusimicrobiales bacterium]
PNFPFPEFRGIMFEFYKINGSNSEMARKILKTQSPCPIFPIIYFRDCFFFAPTKRFVSPFVDKMRLPSTLKEN